MSNRLGTIGFWRLRHLFFIIVGLAALGLLWVTDVDVSHWATKSFLLGLLVCIFAVICTHIVRKCKFDYPEADMRRLFAKAGEESTGAGLALVALAIVIAALLSLFGSAAHAGTLDAHTYIPVKAHTYLPVLRAEQERFWPDHPAPWVLAGEIEQESCISLTHSRCWSPTSRLKTSREEGAGLGQLTRAYTPGGRLRFDALAEMRGRYAPLRELSWSNVYQRPDLQIRAILIKVKGDFDNANRSIEDGVAALPFADLSYNAGYGGMQKDRRACGMKHGCDPNNWFGDVEHTCTRGHGAIYGNRSACDISREHVRNVMHVRSDKYRRFFV